MKSLLEIIENSIMNGEARLMSALISQQNAVDELLQSLGTRLAAMSAQIDALQSRFDIMEQAPKSMVSNNVIFELLQQIAANQESFLIASQTSEPNYGTSQMVQEAKHAVVEAVNALSVKLDDGEWKHEVSEAKFIEAAESTKVFQDDLQISVQLMSEEVRTLSEEVKTLSDVQRTLAQTSDSVLDVKRRIEYSTHQLLTEVTGMVNDRSKELSNSVSTSVERAVKTILDAQVTDMANVTSKIETEISQVRKQIGTMYQTLMDSASTLATLQRQTDTFVNSTITSMNSMNNKVCVITGRMSEMDENLNYLLGRLSLVTQEFKEIEVGLGEALESIRISLETVQKNKKDVDVGPIDERPRSENVKPRILSNIPRHCQ